MPRIDGVLETSLYVDDMKRSARFYHDLLGFEIAVSGERLIAMQVAGKPQLLLLFKKGASASLPKTPHDGDGRLHLAFAIPAEELGAWEARLREQGVDVIDRVTWERGGVSLYFRDPDGHLVELATPGVWTVY
jgi:catechol 2,3-dioxygenase-like lactoylglutathione lyase family enzyme